jgi:hypothetical protein
MDPVDKTFDTVFNWSQKAKRAAQYTFNTLTDTSSKVRDYVVNTVSTSSTNIDTIERPSTAWTTVGISYIQENKWSLAAITVFLGVSGVAIKGFYKPVKYRRRAHRLANGARKDVVLVVGSVTDPLTRHIAYDLSTRGFIVYITSTGTTADHKFFVNEASEDIKSLVLSVDFDDKGFNAEQLRKFDYLLSSDHIPFQGASPNKLELVGIVFVPDLYFPTGKFHLISTSTWTSNMNQKALLPLSLLTNGLIGIAEKYDSNIIFITPTISSSLSLPYHSTENIISTLLQELSRNLSNDYDSLNITNLKLGALNITTNNNRKNFGLKGDSIRKLHYKLFDLLYGEDNSSVQYVGFGARFLSLFGSLVPRFVINNYFRNYFGN